MSRRQSWIACGLLLVLVLGTNRWMSWSEGISFLSASDVEDGYYPVAQAAPALPIVPVPFHKAQRFFAPYLVGMVAGTTGVPIPSVFGVGVALTQLLLLALFWHLLRTAPPRRRLLAFALLVFQPYALRYYWIVPGMFSDVLFELGALVVIAGLARRNLPLSMVGITLAILARQTALLLLPGVMLWLTLGEGLRKLPRVRRYGWGVGLALWTVMLYGITGHVAAHFGTSSENGEHLTGLLTWIFSSGFSFRVLGEHALRCTLPLLPSGALLLAAKPRAEPREFWFLALMAIAVMAQPFLAGPLTTGRNAARLVTLGLPMVVLAWAWYRPTEWSGPRSAALGILLFAGSFHHLYTLAGPAGPMGSATLQLGVAAGAWLLARPPEAATH